MNDPRLDYPRLPLAYVEAITPEQCARYLRSKGWFQERVLEPGRVVLFRHPDNREFAVQILLTREFADYAQLVGFAITMAAAQENRPFWEVYMDMAGRYYVGPHTYATAPQTDGSANGAAKHADAAEVT